MSFHSDMDRYLRDRRRPHYDADPWWNKFFTQKPADAFTPQEEAQLYAMETEIKKGEEQLAHASPTEEPMLEQEQEQRISLYGRFMKLFEREHKLEEVYGPMDDAQLAPIVEPPKVDSSVINDFRALAQIQVRWLERLPTRIKEEFRNSEDYEKYVEILTRRGVGKKKE